MARFGIYVIADIKVKEVREINENVNVPKNKFNYGQSLICP